MKRMIGAAIAAVAIAVQVPAVSASEATEEPMDTIYVPMRSVVVTGQRSHDLIGLIYSREDLYFNDPDAPRFLFFDKEGKVALGIGGQVKGTLHYDFDGAVTEGADFITNSIPTPANSAQRQAFGGDISHSSIFLRMVGRTSKLGYFSIYFQTYFVGDAPGKYGLRLKNAYATLGAFTLGHTNSTFVDPGVGLPTIEEQGPCGEIARRQLQFRYAPRFGNHWSAAIAAEIGPMSVSANNHCEQIAQRVPDFPVYVQYRWKRGHSHVRLAGIVRTMSYRDLMTQKNRFCNGWGLHLSSRIELPANFYFLAQAAYGSGIAGYYNDLVGQGVDLIYASDGSGRMKAPHTLGLEGGFYYNGKRFQATAGWSYARLYGQSHLGPTTYKYANYVVVNGYYNLLTDLKCGLEYNWGQRCDMNGVKGHANRISALLQFSF